MRRAGWPTIAQDRETSVVYGMPKAAADIGAAAEVLPIDAVAPAIVSALQFETAVGEAFACTDYKGSIVSELENRRVTVLLIDDQPMIGEAVRRMLAPSSDIDFHFCADPKLALQRAKDVAPTVILQDLVMPEVDGLTLLKAFRARRGDARRADDRAVDQGGTKGQGRGLRARRPRLSRQAAGSDRAGGAHPAPFERLHRPAAAQRRLRGAEEERGTAGGRSRRGGEVRDVDAPRAADRRRAKRTGSSFRRRTSAAIPLAITGSIRITSPSTCSTCAGTACVPRCCRSRR